MPLRAWTSIAFVFLCSSPAGAADWLYQWGYPYPEGNALHAVDFPTASRGYIAGLQGAVLRSDDGGTNWTRMQDYLSLPANLYDLMALSADTVLAVGDGIWRSTDGGLTFASIPNGASASLRDLAAIPGFGHSAAGENGEVLVSNDRGLTWSPVGPGGAGALIRHHVWTDSLHAWIVGQPVAAKTDDGGQTWTQFLTPPGFGYNEIFFADSLHAYVSEDFGSGYSNDGGETWTVEPFPVEPLYRWRTIPITSDHWFQVAFGEGGELNETADAGSTWTLHEFRGVVGFLGFARTPAGRLIWTSDAADIRYSDDGGQTILQANANAAEDLFADVPWFFDRGDGTVFAASQPSQSNLGPLWARSDNGGRDWTAPAETPGLRWISEGFFADTLVGVVADDAEIAYTDDGGETWNGPVLLPGNHEASGITGSGPGHLLVATSNLNGTGAVFRSSDGGANWSAFGSGLPAGLQSGRIEMFDSANGYLFGLVGTGARLYETADAGSTWTRIFSTGLPVGVRDIAFFDDQLGLAAVFTGGGTGIYRTTDGGVSFAKVTSQRSRAFSLRPDGLGVSMGFAFNDPFVITEDFGANWDTLDAPFAEPFELGPSKRSAALVTAEGLVLGSNRNRILFAEPVVTTGVTGPLGMHGLQPSLSAGTPNPFRAGSESAITFRFMAAAPVRMTVHDIGGREIARLDAAASSAGEYAVTWDGRDAGGRLVAPGVYFVRAASERNTIVRKLTLVR